MKFYNFFEKIQPDKYLIESNSSLYSVCDQLYEQFDLYRANMLREFHKILFDSSAEDYINPLFTIAACFRGMNYNTEYEYESSDNTPNQFTLYGDTISIAQWINDAYYQLTSRDFIQDNVYASKVDLKQFKDDAKDKLHQIYCAIKERVERISNIELLEKRFANIFTSNIAGKIEDCTFYYTDPGYCLDTIIVSSEEDFYTMVLNFIFYHSQEHCYNIYDCVMFGDISRDFCNCIKDMYVLECMYNDKKSLIIPVIIQHRLFFRVINDESPLTLQDLFHINDNSAAYELMDDSQGSIIKKYNDTYLSTRELCFAHRNEDNTIKFVYCNRWFDDRMHEDYSFTYDMYSLLIQYLFKSFSSKDIQDLIIQRFACILNDTFLINENKDVQIAISNTIHYNVGTTMLIITFHENGTFDTEMFGPEMYTWNWWNNKKMLNAIQMMQKKISEFIKDICSITKNYFDSGPQIYFKSMSQFVPELRYYFDKYKTLLSFINIDTSPKIQLY